MAETSKSLQLLTTSRPATVIDAETKLYAPVGDGSHTEITGADLKRLALRAIARELVNPGIRDAVAAWKTANSKPNK